MMWNSTLIYDFGILFLSFFFFQFLLKTVILFKNMLNFSELSKHKETKGVLFILKSMIKNIKILPYLYL
jgi:hypothetical protein